MPPRDLARQGAAEEAGQEHPSFPLLIGNSPVEQQVGQVIQSMAGEAGFDIGLQAAEANALVATGRPGNYQATMVIWSGRPDPDGNVAIWLACDGFLNWGKYCNPTFDDLLATARGVTDVAQRQALIARWSRSTSRPAAHRPVPREMAVGAERQVFRLHAHADGLIRPQGIDLAP